MNRTTLTLLAACGLAICQTAHAADPWADEVVRYAPGTGVGNDFISGQPFTNSSSALGEPTRISNIDGVPTVDNPFNTPAGVTPLSGPYRSYEIVSIGAGGSLVLRFDEPIANDPLNPFGIDLLVFGNAFFTGTFGFPFDPAGETMGILADSPTIEVSAVDDSSYVQVFGNANGLFPTNAFTDAIDGYGNAIGAIPSDFTLPIDPSFDPIAQNSTFAELLAGYNGSGGGLGIDIGPTGLASISFVRISNPAGGTIEIDAVSDVRAVPEPAAGTIVLSLALILLGKSARTSNVKGVT
jgi:hypothetical protein